MTLFWDRQNKPIEDTIVWARKYEDVAYRVVAVDSDGPEAPMVSTIWEGLDRGLSLHQDGSSALIFETALLINGHVENAWLSHTEQEALHIHHQVCVDHLGREPRPEDGHVQTIIERDRKRSD